MTSPIGSPSGRFMIHADSLNIHIFETVHESETLLYHKLIRYVQGTKQRKKTSRERPKSASYLRLNNIQGKTQPIVKFLIYHTVLKNPERKKLATVRNVHFLRKRRQKRTLCNDCPFIQPGVHEKD